MTRREIAENFFTEGYNCSQSVVLAFADVIKKDKAELASVASSFGGGMGRLREVCGAVSGMAIVMGYLKGYSDPADKNAKSEHYKLIQELANAFKSATGSIVCRELLGGANIATSTSPIPDDRSKEYYKKRPCKELVGIAAQILEDKLRSLYIL